MVDHAFMRRGLDAFAEHNQVVPQQRVHDHRDKRPDDSPPAVAGEELQNFLPRSVPGTDDGPDVHSRNAQRVFQVNILGKVGDEYRDPQP